MNMSAEKNTALLTITKVNGQWETLPTDPVVNDILWIFPPEHPSHQQTIKLYTSESPNHPGNTVSTNHSTEAPKWLMENLNYYLNVNFQQQAHSGSVTFG